MPPTASGRVESGPKALGVAAVALARALLVLLMAGGSIALWIGSPLAWLWVGSWLAESPRAQFGPYVAVVAGIVVTSAVLTKLLVRIDCMHCRLGERAAGPPAQRRVHAAWSRSLTADRDERPPAHVLDRVMIVSVSVAAVAFALWFFLAAGNPLPN